MTNRRAVGAAFVALLAVLGCTQALLDRQADQAEVVQAPVFEVDPLWPKPLPNHWLLGMTIGVWVDEQDHVWIIHRSSATLNNNEKGLELNPPTGECCRGAPPVLVFDQAGNLVRHRGGPGPGYEWPESNHGIFVDRSEEHTSELQSLAYLVCRLLLEKKKKNKTDNHAVKRTLKRIM